MTSMIGGFKSTTVESRSKVEPSTAQYIGRYKQGLDVMAQVGHQQMGTDVTEAGTTTSIVTATSHFARKGDLIKFTSGAALYDFATVQETTANTITLSQTLLTSPGVGAGFEVLRPMPLKLDGLGGVIVNGPVSVSTTDGQGFPTALPLGPNGEYGILVGTTDGSQVYGLFSDSAGAPYVNISSSISLPVYNSPNTVTTGNIIAAGTGSGVVQTFSSGAASAVIQVSGTYSATIAWQVSYDVANYHAFTAKRVDTETLETSSGALVNTVRAWEFCCLGVSSIRVYASAYTSGTVNVRIISGVQGTDPNPVTTIGGGTLPAVTTVSTVTTVGTVTNITNQGQIVDNAAFTDGTTRVMMNGYIFDDVAGTALTENDGAAARIDSKRAQVHVTEDRTTRGRYQAVTVDGFAGVSSANFSHSDTFTTTANGTTVDASTAPIKYFSMQCKGTGAAPTTWSVVLEVSLDNVNFTTAITHANADGDGAVKALTTPLPARYFRSRCTALTLGGATNVVTTILGVQ